MFDWPPKRGSRAAVLFWIEKIKLKTRSRSRTFGFWSRAVRGNFCVPPSPWPLIYSLLCFALCPWRRSPVDCMTWVPVTFDFQLDLANGSHSRKLDGDSSETLLHRCSSSVPPALSRLPDASLPSCLSGQGKMSPFPAVTDPCVTHLCILLIPPVHPRVSSRDLRSRQIYPRAFSSWSSS